MGLFHLFKTIAGWRRKRDEKLWKDFESAMAAASALGMRMGRVTRVRPHARTGTKAYVEWVETGQVDAVWAPSLRLSRGQIIPASGRHGHGPQPRRTGLLHKPRRANGQTRNLQGLAPARGGAGPSGLGRGCRPRRERAVLMAITHERYRRV
jgi:hypothetical protein